MAQLANYVQKNGYPAYQNTEVKYFPGGEAFFEELLVQLKNAKRFIFLEYFIIDEGLMWGAHSGDTGTQGRAGRGCAGDV